jgi:hypothetical protein
MHLGIFLYMLNVWVLVIIKENSNLRKQRIIFIFFTIAGFCNVRGDDRNTWETTMDYFHSVYSAAVDIQIVHITLTELEKQLFREGNVWRKLAKHYTAEDFLIFCHHG